MDRYLVTVTLGPVQGLIGAARRTRDLWCGSWLLSEAARAAARVLLKAAPGGLIFPALDRDEELQPNDHPGDEANISNILRAEVEMADEAAVRDLCAQARAAAAQRLAALGERVLQEFSDLRQPVWQAQVDDLLEGFAAWVRIDDGDYAAASRRLAGVLAARKATRDWGPARKLTLEGLPKSSLDGAGETVLPKSPSRSLRQRLGLSGGEQLDALGVLKRAAGRPEQFTAYSRIAADPWIERLSADQLNRLRDAYAPLVDHQLATRVSGNEGCYRALPFDAQMLFDFRLEAELGAVHEEPEAKQALLQLRETLRQMAREGDREGQPLRDPVPYAAILQADGDRMGQLLNKATSAEQSRQISKALHAFSSSVRGLVRDHRGHAIYAGGDDVLALVPLPQAVACAQALADAFRSQLDGVASALGLAEKERPTLSVGLGIGHLVEPLGALRDRAQLAERLAKGDELASDKQRNALALILGIRSGADTTWRVRWDDPEGIVELERYVAAYREGALPTRVAYDLRDIGRRLAWLGDEPSNEAVGMRRAEVARMLDRARTRGDGRLTKEHRQELLQRAGEVKLTTLADTLIIARWLAARSGSEVAHS